MRKKLNIRRQTIRNLTAVERYEVRGGANIVTGPTDSCGEHCPATLGAPSCDCGTSGPNTSTDTFNHCMPDPPPR